MTILILGSVIFFAFHLTPSVQTLHATLTTSLGEKAYRGLYIAGSVVGMIMIIAGKAVADYVPLWTPPLDASRIASLIMLPACILLAAMALPTNIKRYTAHPMLWGMALWAVAHCLANGDLASIICFGGFGAFALRSIWSLNQRGAAPSTIVCKPVSDLIVIVIGLIGYAILLFAHPYAFGVNPLPELGYALQIIGG